MFAPLDCAAAVARDKLVARRALTPAERSAWIVFMLSLFHRSPTHLPATRGKLLEFLRASDPQTEASYAELRSPGDPASFKEWLLSRDPLADEKIAHHLLPAVIQNEDVGQYLFKSRWVVLDLTRAAQTLLISDNPLILRPLKQVAGHIALPISPTLIFLASSDQRFFDHVLQQPKGQLVRDANRIVVGNAYHFVGADDRRQEPFIAKRMGKAQLGSLARGFG